MADDHNQEQDVEKLAEALARKLIDERRAKWIDPDTHHEHHRFIKKLQEDEPRRRRLLDYVERTKNDEDEKADRNARIRERVLGSVVLALALAFVSAVGAWAMPYFRGLIQLLGKAGGS